MSPHLTKTMQLAAGIVDAAFDALSIFAFCGLIYFGAALLTGVA